MKLAVATDAGNGPLVVLCHGFPELPSCWAGQVGPLVAAGFRVVAPYLRGYGESPAPAEPANYTMDLLTGDLVELLAELGEDAAFFVGHDWGAALVWALAQLHPDRVRALAALSVPFTARPGSPPIQRFRERFAGRFFYMDYFQDPGVAEEELGADPDRFLRGMYFSSSGDAPVGAFVDLPREGTRLGDTLVVPATLPPWLAERDLERAAATFAQTGFTGALNYYRAMDLSWAVLPKGGATQVRCPALFIGGERDPVLAFTPTRHMADWVEHLAPTVILPRIGHWLTREAADEVAALLVSFLRGALAAESPGS
ncbi:MAG: alpha/beta fold hydrolase [Mycobacteriales bacterium]